MDEGAGTDDAASRDGVLRIQTADLDLAGAGAAAGKDKDVLQQQQEGKGKARRRRRALRREVKAARLNALREQLLEDNQQAV
jgi:hypothetical protein